MTATPNEKGCSGGEEPALRLHPWLNKPVGKAWRFLRIMFGSRLRGSLFAEQWD
jgi:hypothetical protein